MTEIRIKYSISLWNYFHYADTPPIERIIEQLRQQNYGVELWSSWKGSKSLFDKSERKKLSRLLKGMEVSIHTAGADTLDLHKNQIDTAAECGAQVVVVHTTDFTLKGTSKLDLQIVSQTVEYAGRCGIKLALENGTLPFLTDAVQKVKDLGICLDVGHVYFTPHSMKEFLTALKDRIIHLHLQDILTDKNPALGVDFPEHYIPGTGNIPQADWLLLAETLHQIDFDGMAVFEIAPHNPLQTAFISKTFMQKIINN